MNQFRATPGDLRWFRRRKIEEGGQRIQRKRIRHYQRHTIRITKRTMISSAIERCVTRPPTRWTKPSRMIERSKYAGDGSRKVEAQPCDT